MLRRCEICASGAAPVEAGGVKLRRLLLERRIVALCEAHAEAVQAAGVRTLSALAELFREPASAGRRSLLTRRSPLDRRVFPARPEGRRRGGRRATDID